MTATLLDALQANSETNYIEFKSEFDVSDKLAWCEIIKDIVAITNTGGGVILFGVDDSGIPTGSSPIIGGTLDSAQVTDKLKKYTGYQFSNYTIVECEKLGCKIVSLVIGESMPPLIFTNDALEKRDKKFAFRKGGIYFRHSGKSEPGERDDLKSVLDRHEGILRELWLERMIQVSTAPLNSKMVIVGADSEVKVRVSADPNALPIRDKGEEEFATKEVIEMFNKVSDYSINVHDITCITKVFGIKENPAFCRIDKHYQAPLYLQPFIDWLVEEYQKDSSFFNRAREAYRQMRQEEILRAKSIKKDK